MKGIMYPDAEPDRGVLGARQGLNDGGGGGLGDGLIEGGGDVEGAMTLSAPEVERLGGDDYDGDSNDDDDGGGGGGGGDVLGAYAGDVMTGDVFVPLAESTFVTGMNRLRGEVGEGMAPDTNLLAAAMERRLGQAAHSSDDVGVRSDPHSNDTENEANGGGSRLLCDVFVRQCVLTPLMYQAHAVSTAVVNYLLEDLDLLGHLRCLQPSLLPSLPPSLPPSAVVFAPEWFDMPSLLL
jgi:hypothetical protein